VTTTQELQQQAERLMLYVKAPERLSEVLPGSRHRARRHDLRYELRKEYIKLHYVASLARYIAPDLVDHRSSCKLKSSAMPLLASHGLRAVKSSTDDFLHTGLPLWRYRIDKESNHAD